MGEIRVYSKIRDAVSDDVSQKLVRAVTALTYAYIFLSPFRMTSVSQICFYLSLGIFLFLVAFRKIDIEFDTQLTFPILLFASWAFIGLFFAIYPENSRHDYYSYLLKNVILFFILINIFNTRAKVINLFWTIAISGSLHLLGIFFHFYFILHNSFTSRVDTYPSINYVGFIALITLVLSLHLISRSTRNYIKLLLFLSIALSTFFVLQSKGSLIGLIISLPVLYSRNRKSVLIYTFFLVTSILSIVYNLLPLSDYSFQSSINLNLSRVSIWNLYWNVIKEYPFWGIGYGMEMWQYDDFWNKYVALAPDPIFTTTRYDPHNMYVSLAVHTGVIGLCLFLNIFYKFFQTCVGLIHRSNDELFSDYTLCGMVLVLGITAKAFFEVTINIHFNVILLFTIISIVTVIHRLEKKNLCNTLPLCQI